MVNFLALYRGPSVAQAKLVAVSTDDNLISGVVEGMLDRTFQDECEDNEDPVLKTIRSARRDALNLLLQGKDAEL
jgi:hypothetical protein